MLNRKEHWEKIYSEKKPDQVSWFQANPAKSLELIKQSGVSKRSKIIDVGGGASVLVDRLLDGGFENVSVLDISEAGLAYAKNRLGDKVNRVKWIVADVTQFNPAEKYDLWHDRAVFHFLTDASDREKYVAIVGRAVRPGGHLILASFAPDGPDKCSNLAVCRYDSGRLQHELGGEFQLIREENESHMTPWEKEQKFRYFLFSRK